MLQASSIGTASTSSSVGRLPLVTTGQAAGSPPRPTAAVPLLPCLVSVHLDACAFSSADSLMQLAAATGITRLDLCMLCLPLVTPVSCPPKGSQLGGPGHLYLPPSWQEDATQALLEYPNRAAGVNHDLGQALGYVLQHLAHMQHLSLKQQSYATIALALERAPGSLRELVVTGVTCRL
jgi:hypothetical protein